MSEIKITITEQLQELQMLMHRAHFHGRMGKAHRGQGRVLAMLKMKPEISQKELTFLLGMRKQSLAELLSKLEKNGLVTREQSGEDKRAMTIKLTEAGLEAANSIEEGSFDVPDVFDCLNEKELAQFSGYLERLIKQYGGQFPDEDFEGRRKLMKEFMMQHKFGGHGNHCHHFKHHGWQHKHWGHGFRHCGSPGFNSCTQG
ncbi:MAG: MarR family transcriptional regulator [Clostridiales bacterium]|jgi:DNA-binding MarR family transcriptional regulator|nr:MarR family transcriptional regulator [Clostridiales bacterium]